MYTKIADTHVPKTLPCFVRPRGFIEEEQLIMTSSRASCVRNMEASKVLLFMYSLHMVPAGSQMAAVPCWVFMTLERNVSSAHTRARRNGSVLSWRFE